MLDQTTKRQIDSARQILVGKVPDPKAQVEQITTAMIYKFMDDMDRENEDIGLKAQFFVDEYTKYSWRKLMDNRLSGQERMDLYVEAVANIPKNGNIPQLFRDIFKGAFLPFRDPRTLSLFLKEINEFSYENSENLGNSFEYLLSILGSQGDAGQFRTPRHIIDFIVEVVDPKKNETILDPACGTAGFLISAYKHIIKTNSSNFNPAEEKLENKITQGETATETIISDKVNYTGDLMSPEDKTKLTQNIVGYDISPDMVKLALVNLYLHGFSDPKIFEYDTLSSDKRWGENFDIVMANPPFMTPKGGITPHNKFSIQSSRAELLFIDYILDHINIKGRSGIVVPDSVLSKNETSPKQLRHKLIENGLIAVVSLPAGVFLPYSGVKTSILFIDKITAKQKKEILFIQVNNDGFDLGAQRKKILKNDLPTAKKILANWIQGKEVQDPISFNVKKEDILKTSEQSLLLSNYVISNINENNKYPYITLGDYINTITPPKKIKKTDFKKNGEYPIIDQSQDEIAGWTDDKESLISSEKPLVIFGDHTCAIKYAEQPFAQGADGIKIIQTKDEILPKYLFFLLKNAPIETDGYKRHFSKLKRHKIPLPDISIQKEIVSKIEKEEEKIKELRNKINHIENDIKTIISEAL